MSPGFTRELLALRASRGVRVPLPAQSPTLLHTGRGDSATDSASIGVAIKRSAEQQEASDAAALLAKFASSAGSSEPAAVKPIYTFAEVMRTKQPTAANPS